MLGAKRLPLAFSGIRRYNPTPDGSPRVHGPLPLISFIVPVYNRQDLLRQCLESLGATTEGVAHEVILVDDGSTDGTRDFVASLSPAHRVLLNERNLGFAGSNNRAAAEARGCVLGLLNSDLILRPGWLPPMLRRVSQAQTGLVGNVQLNAATGAVDHTGVLFTLKAKPEHDTRLPRLSRIRAYRRVPAVTAACALVRKEVFQELGGFDEAYHNGGEDIDLCLRAAQAGYLHWVALRSVVLHHVSASPGRKTQDERNSHRLMSRWRQASLYWSSRERARHFLREMWVRPDSAHYQTVLRSALFLGGVNRNIPPALAEAGERAIQVEEARWRTLLADEHREYDAASACRIQAPTQE